MFDQNDQNQQATTVPAPEPVAATPPAEPQAVVVPEPTTAPVPEPAASTPEPVANAGFNTSTLPAPADDSSSSAPVVEPTVSEPAASDAPTTEDGDALLSIKKEALQSLSPLVSKLEQTPEEKYRTTMMLIRASDDKSLIQAAYDAAKDIADDKERAQALLDLVNEINYFTQYKK